MTRNSSEEELASCYFPFYIGYYEKFMKSLGKAKNPEKKCLLDCANGIGGAFAQKVKEIAYPYFDVDIINSDKLEFLNDQCGAEFVQKKQ